MKDKIFMILLGIIAVNRDYLGFEESYTSLTEDAYNEFIIFKSIRGQIDEFETVLHLKNAQKVQL